MIEVMHAGSHSKRKGFCAIKGCTNKAMVKNQLLCSKCYTAFNQRLRAHGSPLVLW
jgi:protein-arginine kinase activator protein McsA